MIQSGFDLLFQRNLTLVHRVWHKSATTQIDSLIKKKIQKTQFVSKNAFFQIQWKFQIRDPEIRNKVRKSSL